MHKNQNFTSLQHTANRAEACGSDQDPNISQLRIEKTERTICLHDIRAILDCSTNNQDIIYKEILKI